MAERIEKDYVSFGRQSNGALVHLDDAGAPFFIFYRVYRV